MYFLVLLTDTIIKYNFFSLVFWRSLFHMDLQGAETSSYGSSEDSRVDNGDAISVNSDVSLPAPRAERLSLEEYALTDEDVLSDDHDIRFGRQKSEFQGLNMSLSQSHSFGVSRSLGSIDATTSSRVSERHFKQLRKTDNPNMKGSNPVAFKRSEKTTNATMGDESPRGVGSSTNGNDTSARHSTKRSKSFESCKTSGDDRTNRQRLPSNFR